MAQVEAEDRAKSWTTTLRMIRARFPAVPQVPTDTLQSWLDRSPKREDLLLLDVRESQEYSVSHLRGARPAPSKDEALEILRGVPANRRIVLYCSVGYRSSELARFLMERGYRKVCNLEGSIFRWANEGRPVYRGEERVRVVHPYDSYWGRLLKKPLHPVDWTDTRAPRAPSE
ncbi:MAG: rhodanese-like domain-containing protein [Gemmatimonadota bacterium]|nr:rhodanese-like domain-containing protein [Gemmatimonadota bacterium]